MFLTYDEQSKAIAQLSQVRHKVHQNQELRGTAAERESVYLPSMICADVKQKSISSAPRGFNFILV